MSYYNIEARRTTQPPYFNAGANVPHTPSTKDLSSYKYDVSNVVARTKQHYTAGLAGRAFGDADISWIDELGRIPRILMRGGSQRKVTLPSVGIYALRWKNVIDSVMVTMFVIGVAVCVFGVGVFSEEL